MRFLGPVCILYIHLPFRSVGRHFVQDQSIRGIARESKMHRRTVRQAIIRPFQMVRILSSLRGRTRSWRLSNSFFRVESDKSGLFPITLRLITLVHEEGVLFRLFTRGFLLIVAFCLNSEPLFELCQLLGSEQREQFFVAPGVELAFLHIAVRIFRRSEFSLRRDHVPKHVGQDLPRCTGVELLLRRLVGFGVGQRNRRVWS